eukprot:957216-Rhodomonas_salina.1
MKKIEEKRRIADLKDFLVGLSLLELRLQERSRCTRRPTVPCTRSVLPVHTVSTPRAHAPAPVCTRQYECQCQCTHAPVPASLCSYARRWYGAARSGSVEVGGRRG